jgi:hexosaminidase
MSDFIRQHGRTPAGWDEITAAATQTNTIIFWWRHDKPEVLANALAAGYPVVLAPRAPCYFDYPQDETFSIPTGRKLYNTLASVYEGPQIPSGISSAELHQILGVEACIWTERIGTVPYLEFMTLPRLAALGEMAWTPDESRSFSRFDARLKPFLDQYRKAGIHFYDETNPQGSLDDAKALSRAASLPRNSGLNN